MHPLLEQNQESIIALCKEHKVKSLFVFGSILREDFRDDSDVDFLVNFNKFQILHAAKIYFGLRNSLKDILRGSWMLNKWFTD